ncbi:hypothetical protein [Komagataeibacter sp. FXV3]|uniref:hypothetical protein n=1 Tax=Komagataeibacter sp. FXV3 TaxID=2608998 RepID=UPI00187B69C2|nr:hypothetical protein [Komagataeibacter sp. FXV3]MBE7729841.1 hypothetical protein [Komagataeibacter sp. FXV3]
MNNSERKRESRKRAKSTLSTREALSEWLIRQMAILYGSDNIDINAMFYESLDDTQKKNVEKILAKEWKEKIHIVIL